MGDPDGVGAPDHVCGVERPKIAAVETVGRWREEKDIAASELTAALPYRHEPVVLILPARVGHTQPAYKDTKRETADAIAGKTGRGLQNIFGCRKIPAALGQHDGRWWQACKDEIITTKRLHFNAVEPNRNAGGCVPNKPGCRRVVGCYQQKKSQYGNCRDGAACHVFGPEEECRRPCSDHCFNSVL